MILKKTFITHTVAGEQIMVPVGVSAKNFHGFIRSNETAAFIVDQFRKDVTEADVTAALLEEYDVSRETAEAAVHEIVEKLRAVGAFA